jgi:hypothetical protein
MCSVQNMYIYRERVYVYRERERERERERRTHAHTQIMMDWFPGCIPEPRNNLDEDQMRKAEAVKLAEEQV